MVTERECGSCSMCCKLLFIEELSKPEGSWCPKFNKGTGCGIYITRPQSCRDYRCRWLDDGMLGDEWRPDRCRFTMHFSESGIGLWLNVDPSQPLAWKAQPFYSTVKSWSRAAHDGTGYVAVRIKERTIFLFPEEDLEVHGASNTVDIQVGYRMNAHGRQQPLVRIGKAGSIMRETLGQPIPR